MSDKTDQFDTLQLTANVRATGPSGASEDADGAELLATIRRLVGEEAALHTPADQSTLRERLDGGGAFAEPDPLMLTQTVAEAPPAPFADEAALRALITDIVREELKGEMGDRLTKNVRKMIRREIAVALSIGARE